MNRWIRMMIVLAMVVSAIGLCATASLASPAVHLTFHEHQAVFVFPLEDEPACPLAPGTITNVENGVGHLTAAGIDEGNPDDPDDDTVIPPARMDLNQSSDITYVPDDPSLETLTGHAHTHFAWNVDENGIGPARIERTIVIQGDDGARFFLHQLGRAVFNLSQIDSPNEGLVEVTVDEVRCGK